MLQTRTIGLTAAAGIAASFAATTSAAPVDISSYFNRDVIGLELPTHSNSWRSQNKTLAAGAHEGDDDDHIPTSGVINAGGFNFNLGPFMAGPDVNEPNAVTIGSANGGMATNADLDIFDQQFTSLGVLFAGFGYNVEGDETGNNGTLTVVYGDGTQDVFEWDVTNQSAQGADPSGTMAKVAMDEIALIRNATTMLLDSSSLSYQEFAIPEGSIIDRLIFDTSAVVDGANADAEFAIFAVDSGSPIPSPGALALLGLGGLAMRRRR